MLTRDLRKVEHWRDRIQATVGSFDQPETLDTAMRGVEQVFLMSAGEGTCHIEAALQAAKRAGVKHIVYLSSSGAMEQALQIGQWHRDREAVIEASGLTWTFVRPGQFMSNALMWAETIKTQGAVYFPGYHIR